ncbi:unnamed protein product [Pleuronectes platessa]|uniref:CBM21 domain-containing protein n=1 Tax=Pleuronectes platessa TaxID=8262 RepID=A0A9N7TQR5_PLEPL|nr:unnamed protein product [Pleuronectes platessa]
MLNVSCQEQKHCKSFPAASLTESPMEFVGQTRLSGSCNLLGVPGPSSLDEDSDEGEVVLGIRPKSSPLPRRRGSSTDEDWEPEPPLSGSRRVSFADAKGLRLVQVKEFDTWDVPKLPGYGCPEGEGTEAEEYFLSPHTFSFPLSTEELFAKVQDQRLELETIELLHNKTTILKGVIRVLNISFSKTVYVRITLDAWSSYFDLLAEFTPGSNDSLMDCFSFKLTLVPPFGEQGARVEFCLRYETPVGTFWANNNNRNYVLFCHQKVKDKPQTDNVNKKSCLKTVSQNFFAENISTMDASPEDNTSAIPVVSKYAVEATTMKAKQISDGQDGHITKHGRNESSLVVDGQTENKRISSRRSGKKAARIARARDHFAQRGKGGSDTERDETPPEAKQAAREEKLVEKPSDVPSLSEGGNGSELSQVVSEALDTRSKSLTDVLHDTTLANDSTSNSEPEKSESKHLTDSATLTGGGSATDTSDEPLHSQDESAPAKSICRAEGETQEQHTGYETTNNSAVDSVTSVETSEGLVGQNTSFTFGTVVAPLYQHMFYRVGCESEYLGETEVNDEEDESMTRASDNHTCGNDTFMESKEGKLFKDEPMSAALLREDLADTTEENNWEMMVEEDEKIILADQEENKATCLKADTETEQTGRSEDTGIETELEDTNSAEREKDLSEELRGNPGENGTEAEDAEGLEDKENDGEEIWKVGELENVQSKNTEKKEAEEEHRDGDIEMEKGEEQEETELDKEQHFAEMQEVSIGRIDVREVEEIEGEEEMQTDLNNGYDNGVVWDDQVKPREENAEEEIPNYEGRLHWMEQETQRL